MAMRQLEVQVFDDGVTVCLNVMQYDSIGGVTVGPKHLVSHHHSLSYPTDPEQWARDMVVQVLELL